MPATGRSATELLEHLPWHRDLGQLEPDVAAVAYYLGADLDQLLAQAGQRPRLGRPGHRPCSQEVAEVIGERMELKADGVGGEGPARQPSPLDRAVLSENSIRSGFAL